MIAIPSAGGSLNRSGTIVATLQYGDEEVQVSAGIFQIGDNYTVDPTTAVIPPEGGSFVVTVESDYTLNDYTSVTGVTAGTYNMERLSSNKIQITFDFGPNYGSPISMTPKLESILYGTSPIPLTTITQDTFVFNWDFPTTPVHLGNERSIFTIEFTSNTEIENIIISNVPDWLTFTRNGNTITGVASRNTGETRSVTLTFTADGFGVSKQLEVTQDALV